MHKQGNFIARQALQCVYELLICPQVYLFGHDEVSLGVCLTLGPFDLPQFMGLRDRDIEPSEINQGVAVLLKVRFFNTWQTVGGYKDLLNAR